MIREREGERKVKKRFQLRRGGPGEQRCAYILSIYSISIHLHTPYTQSVGQDDGGEISRN